MLLLNPHDIRESHSKLTKGDSKLLKILNLNSKCDILFKIFLAPPLIDAHDLDFIQNNKMRKLRLLINKSWNCIGQKYWIIMYPIISLLTFCNWIHHHDKHIYS